MFCKYCGYQISDAAVYCSHCGKKLTGSVGNRERNTQVEHSEETTPEVGSVVTEPTHKAEEKAYRGKYSSKKTQKKTSRIILRCIYVAFLICVTLYVSNPDNNLLNIRDMRKAYTYSQEVVKEEFTTPNCEFPKFDADFVNQRSKLVEFEGDEYRVYTVTAYVYAETVFGTQLRWQYSVDIGFATESGNDDIYYNLLYLEVG